MVYSVKLRMWRGQLNKNQVQKSEMDTNNSRKIQKFSESFLWHCSIEHDVWYFFVQACVGLGKDCLLTSCCSHEFHYFLF